MESDRKVEQFFASISGGESAYSDGLFTYLAVRQEAALLLVSGSLTYQFRPAPTVMPVFNSPSIQVGQVRFSDLKMTGRQIVAALEAGEIEIPGGRLLFSSPPHGLRESGFTPFSPGGITTQRRIASLLLAGQATDGWLYEPHIDWELRASNPPYHSLRDLQHAYGLNAGIPPHAYIEFTAITIAEIDAGESTVDGTKARVGIFFSPHLPTDKVSLGLIVQGIDQVHERRYFSSNDLTWTTRELSQYGLLEVTVPEGAIVNCIVSYDGLAQHYFWIGDPKVTRNPRRAALEAADGELKHMVEFLSAKKKQPQDDFELAVAWLFWLLGFSAAHLGTVSTKLMDWSDMIVATPRGNLAIVECTVGNLKADTKLQKLVTRVAEVRKRLDAGNNKNIQLLPVMVSAKDQAELDAEIEEAQRYGVYVMTRESIDSALARTAFINNADRTFDEALAETEEARLRLNKAKTDVETLA
ncbi:MAG: hypothetical protein IPK59_04035 [Rhodospirillaceae bacterium]|nr:hypothetical protein [Rhodospirillaceae bacterium]